MTTSSRTRNPKAGTTAVPAAMELALIGVIWATRASRAGDLAVVISPKDQREMEASMTYLKADPALLIHHRPDGGIVAAVVQRGTTDTIVAVESDEERFDAAQAAANARAAKENAAAMAARLEAETSQGTHSSDTVDEVCAILRALAA